VYRMAKMSRTTNFVRAGSGQAGAGLTKI
jgi:hypothetical protein